MFLLNEGWLRSLADCTDFEVHHLRAFFRFSAVFKPTFIMDQPAWTAMAADRKYSSSANSGSLPSHGSVVTVPLLSDSAITIQLPPFRL